MTLVSDVAVILVDAQSKGRLDSARKKNAVAAAALIDLALAGYLEVAQARSWRPDLVALRSTTPTGDSVLDACLGRLAKTQQTGADVMVGQCSLGTWAVAMDQLLERGVLARGAAARRRLFGPPPLVLAQPEAAREALAEIAETQASGRAPSTRALGLVGVLDGARLWRKVMPMDRPDFTRSSRSPDGWLAAGVAPAAAAAAAAISTSLSTAVRPD